MFQKPDPKQSFPALEHEMIEYWKKEKIFQKSLEKNKGRKEYVFYDGPPFATGLPHYGHILAGTLKDVVPRYQTMRGYYVPRRWGWDCHGLPIENLVEQELKLDSKKAILDFGIDKFNEACRSSNLKYVREWGKIVERTGRWVDFEDSYKTMDTSFMESIWWVFKSLWDKKLIYRGKKTMHICPRCETPLSNFEVGLGYKDVSDLSVIWKFELRNEPKTFLLAWTTTPWSTLSTMGLSINPEVQYLKVRIGGEKIIFAKERQEFVLKGISDFEVLEEIQGSELVGSSYHPVAPWYLDIPEVRKNKNVYTVFPGDYVEVSEGTGIVTINGSYGEIDFEAAKKNKLPIIMDVGMNGRFTELGGPFEGMAVKEAEKKELSLFSEKGLIFRSEPYTHSYPHCWRCDTALLNYCTDSWFVSVEKIKKKMLKNNEKIHWVPEHIKHGRFGKWLENARDWAISRNRYWGTPLPIWESDKGSLECMGSIADLRERVPGRFTKLTFLRHAQSEGNSVGLRQSRVPGTPLTETGKKQAHNAAEKLRKVHQKEPFDLLISSPLLRCEQTAKILGAALELEVQTDDLIREIDFGVSEGKRDSEMKDDIVRRRGLSSEEHFRDKLGKTGESHRDVAARSLEFVKKMVREHPGKSILVVGHSDGIRFLLKELENKSLETVYQKGHLPQCEPMTVYIDNETGTVADLHKHLIDKITYHHPETGELMKRVPEVLDCWFESGSMPYAQVHYPFENKGQFETTFPANFIAEGLDQTRGWFYTLTVLASALFDKPAFQNIIVNGIVLAEDGQKMSKRKKNYPDPSHIFESYGVDAMRLYLMNSPVVKAEDLRFSEKGVQEVLRSTLIPFWNAYSFFVTYAEIDQWRPKNQIYFVRHGETAVNKEGGVQGTLDEPLNDRGRDQVQELRKIIKHLPIDVMISSNFLRTKETAEILNGDINLELQIVDDLREQHYGALEGKSFEELEKMFPGSENIHFAVRISPEGGEELKAFEKRVLKALKTLEKKYAGKNILISGHAGVLHVLRKRQMGIQQWKTYFKERYSMAKNAQLTVFSFETRRKSLENTLDRWIISELHTLIRGMTKGLDQYDLMDSLSHLVKFIESLTNWYIRRSRRRFWKSANDEDKNQAYQTLYTVLTSASQLLSPFAPFITEAIFRNLTGLPSVHLSDWPEFDESTIDEDLNAKTAFLQQVVTLGHSARSKATLKVRQPLHKISLIAPHARTLVADQESIEIIQEELNVKELEILSSVEGHVRTILKPNARMIGPIYGAAVQDIIREAKAGHFEKLENGNVKVLDYELSPDQVEIQYLPLGDITGQVASDQGIVVILDTRISPELLREGYARDIIRSIQDLRKQADLNVSDRIKAAVTTDVPEIQHAISEFQGEIQKETLAVELASEKLSTNFESVVDLGGHGVVVSIEKI